MSNEENESKVVQLRESYQGSGEKRGHQVGLDKGYQPKAEPVVMIPPEVGTTTVATVNNSTTTPSDSGAKTKE